MKKFFVKILGNEKTQNIAIPLFSILLSLIVGMIVIGALGKYPLRHMRICCREADFFLSLSTLPTRACLRTLPAS